MTELGGSQAEVRRKVYPLATWLALKTDFIRGRGTLTDLCRKHGINYQTANSKSCLERWGAARTKWLKTQNGKFEEVTTTVEVPTPEAKKQSQIETITAQLSRIDDALMLALIPRDIADLTKAKLNLEQSLYLALHGAKPGTMKPMRPGGRRQSWTASELPLESVTSLGASPGALGPAPEPPSATHAPGLERA